MSSGNPLEEQTELHHLDEFQHNLPMFEVAHNGNHDGTVRIFILSGQTPQRCAGLVWLLRKPNTAQNVPTCSAHGVAQSCYSVMFYFPHLMM